MSQPTGRSTIKPSVLAKAALRRVQVLDLVSAGATLTRVGQQVGVSTQQASQDLKRILGDLMKEKTSDADMVRALQMERYNRLLLVVWSKALKGDLDALDRALRIMDKISVINGVIPEKSLLTINNILNQTVEVNLDDFHATLINRFDTLVARRRQAELPPETE